VVGVNVCSMFDEESNYVEMLPLRSPMQRCFPQTVEGVDVSTVHDETLDLREVSVLCGEVQQFLFVPVFVEHGDPHHWLGR
jgi:hypothetical protein